MIVATAGHVDHGKTSLVRALTQVDTDRLAEEQRRGMSIDLGYAYAELGGGAPIGFVDVPGHERFIANMLAGVAAIDLALLVVAADDGPMPQTREHLAILALLGVPRCVVALTKVDRVDPERRRRAEAEVDALLAPGPYRGAPRYPVVATTGSGVAALAAHLGELARSEVARPDAGRFRLAVDRSFVVAGAGRVVTGAVLSGTVRPGDALTVSPGSTAVRVRGLRAQNRVADCAVAGQRCALNLVGTGLKDAAPVRGDWVVAPDAHAPTDRLDVRLEVPAGLARPLAHRSTLQLHLGAAALPVRLALPDGGSLAPGASGWAQLVLARPVAALHGDRFILRDPAAGRVVAGGRVVDPHPAPRGRASPQRAARLAALDTPCAVRALQRLVATTPEGVDLARFALARNLGDADAAALPQRAGVTVVAADGAPRALAAVHWQACRDGVGDALARWHAAQPASPGPAAEALLGARVPRAAGALRRAALDALLAEGRVVHAGLRVRLADHVAVLPPADAALLARVEAELAPAGLRPPIVGELATRLEVPLPALLDVLSRAGELGALLRVAPNRYFLPRTVAELAAHARALAQASAGAGFDAAAFRDRTGIGRNLTVQVLEFLDREGVTRFDGERRTAPAA